MNQTIEKARAFICRNARPLELARWQYHFEGASKKIVLHALSYYQNADGGFGHALEPDAWNPNSSPIQTLAATEILHEIGFDDHSHSIVEGILRYLGSGADFDGKFWYTAVRSNNDYPHAPWWHAESDSICHSDYNPTACLTGFILRFAQKESALHALGRRVASEVFTSYMGQGLLKDPNSSACLVRLAQYCEEARETNFFDLSAVKEKLGRQVKHCITHDTASWETNYICKPSSFFRSRDGLFYPDNRDIAEYECEFIEKTQLDDGSWPIPWRWQDYPEQWAVSKNWWKSNGAILNLLYLKGFDRL